MERIIGPIAKSIRLKKGIKLNFISEKLGYASPSSWIDIENGRRRLDADKIPTLANALGVSVEQLFFEEKIRVKRIEKEQEVS